MEVKFHKNFKKKFNKLPEKMQVQFLDRLTIFMKDKFDHSLNNHAVDRVYQNCRSINVSGDYRAIFEDQGDLAIFILIGTHAELYK